MSLSRTLLAAVFSLSSLTALAAESVVRVSDPYVRAVPPGQPNSAAFMSLTNGSEATRALVAAESAAAKTLELHTHVHEDGVMRMRQIPRIEIPPGQTVLLAPGGLHVMLIGLKEELKPGGVVDIDLSFDDGSRTRIQAPVRAIAPVGAKH